MGGCDQAVYRQVADARRVVDEYVLVGLIDRLQDFLQAEKPISRIGLQSWFYLQHLLPVGWNEVNVPGVDGNICIGDDFENGALGIEHQQAGDVIVGAKVPLLALSKETARQGNVGIGLLVQVYDKDPSGLLTWPGIMPEHQTESGTYVDSGRGLPYATFLTETGDDLHSGPFYQLVDVPLMPLHGYGI